jgi:hypothetical protein
MKQKDLALILIIVFISVIFSYIVSSKVFGTPKSRQQEVDVVQPISSSFQKPDSRFFNSNSYDPTQVIQIGQNNNQNPF